MCTLSYFIGLILPSLISKPSRCCRLYWSACKKSLYFKMIIIIIIIVSSSRSNDNNNKGIGNYDNNNNNNDNDIDDNGYGNSMLWCTLI